MNWWVFWGTGIQGVHTAEQEAKSRNRYNHCFGGPGRAWKLMTDFILFFVKFVVCVYI